MQWSLHNAIAYGIGIWTFGICSSLPEVHYATSVNGHLEVALGQLQLSTPYRVYRVITKTLRWHEMAKWYFLREFTTGKELLI